MKIKNINKKNNSLKAVLILVIILILLTGGAVFALNYHTLTPASKTTTPHDNNTPKSTDTSNPQPSSSSEGVDKSSLNDKSNPTSITPSALKNIDMTISAANQTANTYQVRTIINTVTNEGTCNLTMTQGSKIITKTSDIQAGPSNTTCRGFDIAMTELSSGIWNLSVGFQNTTYQGTVSKEIVIN